MKSIIEELLHSELCQDSVNLNPKRIKELAQKEIEFEKMLGKKQRKFYRDLSEERFELCAGHEKEYFKCGFKLGFNVVIEAITP